MKGKAIVGTTTEQRAKRMLEAPSGGWGFGSVGTVLAQSACTQSWDGFPALHRLIMVACANNPSIQEKEAERSEIQGHLRLHSEYEVNLGYMGPCFKAEKILKKEKGIKRQTGEDVRASELAPAGWHLLFHLRSLRAEESHHRGLKMS